MTKRTAKAQKEIQSKISAGVKKSWEDKKVRAARSQRNGVKVGKTEYRSVRQAFQELGLPDSKHIAFRGKLNAAGKLEFDGHKFELI